MFSSRLFAFQGPGDLRASSAHLRHRRGLLQDDEAVRERHLHRHLGRVWQRKDRSVQDHHEVGSNYCCPGAGGGALLHSSEAAFALLTHRPLVRFWFCQDFSLLISSWTIEIENQTHVVPVQRISQMRCSAGLS